MYFRAPDLATAHHLLTKMVDLSSLSLPAVDVPTVYYAWGGVFIDQLNHYVPAGLSAQIISYALIALALVVCAFPNAYQLTTTGRMGWGKTLYMSLLFSIALYATISSSSAVFLYYNF